MADQIGEKLYCSGNINDLSEKDDVLQNIVNSLNNMKNEDKNKAMDILREKADDENKIKQLKILKETITKDKGVKNFIKNIINKQEKEEKKLDNAAEDLLEELDSDCTLLLTEEEKNNDSCDKKQDKVGKVLNILREMEKYDQSIILEKLKYKSKKSGQKDKIKKVYSSLNAINKMKNYEKDIKNKLQNSKNPHSENNKSQEEDET